MELNSGTVGVGWIIWRGVDYLPKELIFELHYLGEVSSLYTATIFELMIDRLLVQSQFL
jgi:glutamate/tyrosine decarboxylase-like PLP-dependent enzyme